MVPLMTSKPAPPGGVVSANIRAEAARQQRAGTTIAKAIGMSYRSWSNRLAGRVPWRDYEVRAVAAELDVPVYRLYEDQS